MERVAVIAGTGYMPSIVARSLLEKSKFVGVISIEHLALNLPAEAENRTLSFTQLGTLWQQLADWKIESVVFAGGVAERPEFPIGKIDFVTLCSLPRILTAIIGNDDHVLRAVADIFEDKGYRVVGLPEIAPQILCRAGKLGALKCSQAQMDDLEDAYRIAKGLGALDVGQGAIVRNGRTLAVEAAEGTDGMLARVKKLKEDGRLSKKAGGVLVKCAKPMQDLRFDLPTVGPETLDNMAAAGLTALGIEENRCVILHDEEFFEKAKALKIAVFGFAMKRDRRGE